MDLKFGETCTALFYFISGGAAYTFNLPFDADKAVITNLTKFGGSAGYISQSIWYKNGLAEPYALQYQSTNDGSADYSSINITTNGFSEVITPASAPSFRANITAITTGDPAVVTYTALPATQIPFQTGQIVRITDLGDQMPVHRGASDVNNNRYLIVVVNSTSFQLFDPITGDAINRTGQEAYVTGGRIDLESRVISLNNPQQYPYQYPNSPYIPTPFVYNPETWALTAGTAVMGVASDVMTLELYKFGQVINLNQL